MSDIDNTANQGTIAKLDAHHRQQLSALLDGALPPDEAQFLLRRLQHDKELSACIGRWQLVGDVMRGRLDTPLPAGFAGQVADAVARERPQVTNASHRGWARGLGATALAASVALAAVLFTQRLPPQAGPGDETPTPITSAPIVSEPLQLAPAAIDASPIDASPSSSEPAGLATHVAAPTAIAIAAPTPRSAAGRDPDDAGLASDATAPATVIATTTPDIQLPLPTADNPFLPSTLPPARPWPRAALPDFPVSGAFTASHGDGGESAASFYPFEPRLPAASQRDADPRDNVAGPDVQPY